MNGVNHSHVMPKSNRKIGPSGWTAGPIIDSYERKGFNRTGSEMKMLAVKTYLLKVFPPQPLAQRMQRPSPDVLAHLEHEGIDTHRLDKRDVAFLAHVTLPIDPEDSAVEITLISEQRQNGGVYKQETRVPRDMLCIRASPVDTVLDSLNNALNVYQWYPPF